VLFTLKICEKDGIAMENTGILIVPDYQNHKGL
jgi:hypothetical protein